MLRLKFGDFGLDILPFSAAAEAGAQIGSDVGDLRVAQRVGESRHNSADRPFRRTHAFKNDMDHVAGIGAYIDVCWPSEVTVKGT